MRGFVFSLLLVLLLAIAPALFAADGVGTDYQSPYGVKLPWPIPDLIPDLLEGKRGEPGREAKIPESDWYGHSHPWVGPWGPLPQRYKPPRIAEGKGDDWKRARIIATALRFIGYHYRHHYVPDWDPPPGWYNPKPGGTRHDGKGLDCSNFTSFVYNQGLGIHFSSDVQKQAATETVTINGTEQSVAIKLIPRQDSAEAWARVLKPGDLLFIRPRNSETVSHVVIWVGPWGTPDGIPLVMDSHGADVRDEDGKLIPDGIHLRPFRPNSWYATRADHGLRIIGE